MKGSRKWLVLALVLAAAFLGGLVALFNADFASGELYPEYSTLRAGPSGSKLIFDSLARLPGMTMARNFLPLQNLAVSGTTVVILGLHDSDFDVIENLAKSGARVVAAFRRDWKPESKDSDAIFKRWQVRVAQDSGANREFPLYFFEAHGWDPLEKAGTKLVAIQRTFGKGSVALLAASNDFSNQSVVASDRLPQVVAALGANSRIVFDESHLGIAESGSVMGLARRFRMIGIAAGFAILAVLFIWRNASAFPPPEAMEKEAANPLIGRTSASGLLTLLRKNIAPRDLTAACWQEWLAGRRREFSSDHVARAETIARGMADRPLEAAREIQALLHSKGTL